MKKYLVLLLQIFVSYNGLTQEVDWAKRISARPDLIHEDSVVWKGIVASTATISAGASGDIYAATYVQDSTHLEVGATDTLLIRNAGIVISKFTPEGEVIWKKKAGDFKLHYNSEVWWAKSVVDNDGNLWLAGTFSDTLATFMSLNHEIKVEGKKYSSPSFLVKYDKDGELIFATSTYYDAYFDDMITDNENNLIITGAVDGGIQLDENTYLPPAHAVMGGTGRGFYLAKYNSTGDLLWARAGKSLVNPSCKITSDLDGNVFMAGRLQSNMNQKGEIYLSKNSIDDYQFHTGLGDRTFSQIFMAKYSSDGVFNFYKSVGPTSLLMSMESSNSFIDITHDPRKDGVIIAAFSTYGIDVHKPNNEKVIIPRNGAYVFFLSNLGNIDDIKVISQGGVINEISSDANNMFFKGVFVTEMSFINGLSAEIYKSSIYGRRTDYIAKFEFGGQFKWARVLDPNADLKAFSFSSNGKFVLGGTFNTKVLFDNYELEETHWSASPINPSIKISATSFVSSILDNDHHLYSNTITGKVSDVFNQDCLDGKSSATSKGIIIKTEPQGHFTSVDDEGNYSLSVGKGTYTIKQILPKEDARGAIKYQQQCPSTDGYTITFDSYGNDTTGFDFVNHVEKKAFLSVNVAADRRRRCFTSTTAVEYCNEGYAQAENVMVDVYYPEYVVPISANVPWIKNGNILSFDLGSLGPGSCGTIYIADSVICGNETIRGLTQCVKAVISPFNAPVELDPAWDLSDVTLKSVCKENGIIQLSIINSGSGNMADSSAYSILLDAVEVFKGEYKLQSGDSLTLQVPANGKTLRLEVDLPVGHPDKGRVPNISLEGCGTSASGDVSTGFVSLLPADDTQAEVSFSCLPILDSYDPNDKQVTPAGVGPERIIAEGQELEYLIRFQNTGTDVAYNVSIEDVLSENLDISTLKIGAASHPFTWSVGGRGQPKITWKFENINLPDSSTNEPGSHGFVRFKIKQKKENSIGTIIENKAAIFFDFNSPIITNIVSNKVGILPLETSHQVQVDICSGNYPTTAQAGDDIQLDRITSALMSGNAPLEGVGRWRLLKGNGTIEDPSSADTQITHLAVGKNTFEWSITLCDSLSTSQVVVERVVIPPQPAVEVIEPYCYGDPLLPARALGNDISWYADDNFEEKLHSGQEYLPTLSTYERIYVSQTVDGYSSEPLLINISIKPQVEIPAVSTEAYICNGQLVNSLIAQGEDIQWFSDPSATNLLQAGEEFSLSDLTPMDIFVTQTIDGCTSPAKKVSIFEGFQDLKKNAFVPNIITPNGDGKNDEFNQPTFEPNTCIGKFLSIQIYNKWGNSIFSSSDATYSWDAQDVPNGLYYYNIKYDNLILKGQLTVMY